MTQESFVKEVEKRLLKIFRASKEGYKATEVERRHLEGFIQAGVFMEVTTNDEMKRLIDSTHGSVFGQSIQERKQSRPIAWSDDTIDYSSYDTPTKYRE